jgi:hypothetical protein
MKHLSCRVQKENIQGIHDLRPRFRPENNRSMMGLCTPLAGGLFIVPVDPLRSLVSLEGVKEA